jgi:hypothetical protein
MSNGMFGRQTSRSRAMRGSSALFITSWGNVQPDEDYPALTGDFEKIEGRG